MSDRIVIAGGVRTPYIKAGTLFKDLTAADLGRLVVSELIARTGIDPDEVDSVIIGNVAQPPEAVNVARVISLYAGVPENVPAYTVHRNCASGIQSVISAAQSIATGEAEVVVAGGVESMTNIPLFLQQETAEILTKYQRAMSWKEKLSILKTVRPRHFTPRVGLLLGLTDPTCGLNMGQTAEVLARELGISRQAQDELALLSHQRAAAAHEEGRFAEEIMPVFAPPNFEGRISFDNGIRPHQTMEQLAKLRPVFDRTYGSVTAGNASQITDGGAAVLVTTETAAARLGLEPIGYLVDHSFAGLEPKRMGLGPSYATSLLLEKTGMEYSEIGLMEMNEAFAAQIIANEMVFADDSLSEHFLGCRAIGAIDRTILNVNGGAIAMGHPVGSSGTRIILTLLLEMRRREVDLGLATLCVGGGQGAAVLFRRT
ncbi:MAG: thiolase family protein [bacterium]|nr:MAG: thiolase family protein [bacterium]